MLTLIVVSLLIAAFPARVYVQDLSVKDTNILMEIFNSCTCLPQSQCDDNSESTTVDYSTIIKRRMKTNVNKISCKSYSSSIELFCCKQPILSTTTSIIPVVKNPDTQNAILEVFYKCKCLPEDQCDVSNSTEGYDPSKITKRRVSQNASRIRCQSESSTKLYCCKQPDNDATPEVQRNRPKDEKETKCGTGLWSFTPRILAGTESEAPSDGEFSWMAAIFRKRDHQIQCGGSLIHPKVVLTASHCVHRKRPGNLKVSANGKVKLPSKEEEERDVVEIIKHPRYRHFGRLYNDAALLVLDRPFPMTGDNRINTLCLPPSDIDLDGAVCYVAGWGKDINNQSGQGMKKVLLPFVDHSQCQTSLRRTLLGKTFTLHQSFMCAGGEKGKDACVGDGGGPLMCEMPSEEERYFQAGIVSWGIGCGQEDIPGVYTDVKKVSQWIRSQLAQRNLNI